jgi:prolyl-tRNA editing enzyme YbaK/EbsC (Cys-tRNA(Pro) deacylase)
MTNYEEKLKQYIKDNNIKAEHLSFNQSCHSVLDACKVVNAVPEDFVKNICMFDKDNNLIVAIVKGEDKVDLTKIAGILNIPKPRIATVDEILEKTGYPCGGTPSFGYKAIFLIDSKVMEKEFVYSGGGSEKSLLKISTIELQKANNGQIVKIRK